jgi:cbb3-type cytochrome oxidase subunit 3
MLAYGAAIWVILIILLIVLVVFLIWYRKKQGQQP